MQTDTIDVTKVTPKTFHDPLLKVLGNLAKYEPRVPVDHKMVYQPVLDLIGMGQDDHGLAKGTNVPQTFRWIQFAFKNLRDNGLAVMPRKGQWALTDEGVATARQLSGLSDEETPADAPQVASSVVDPLPLPTLSVYDSDPYLRSLAAEATECFGHYSDRAQTCSDCPLANPCQNRLWEEMVVMAEELRQEDAALIVKAQSVAPAAQPAPKKRARRPLPKGTTLDKIVNQMDTVCAECGEKIAKGADCYWRSDEDGMKSGLLHLECHDG